MEVLEHIKKFLQIFFVVVFVVVVVKTRFFIFCGIMSLPINEVHTSLLEAHKVTPVIKQLSHFVS